MPVYQLPDDPMIFPRPELAEPDGLLAVGGDLTPRRLLGAYSLGIFPWYNEGEPILWWSPDPRFVLEPEELHVSRSLRKVLRRGELTATADSNFEGVITSCASTREERGLGTWLSPEMIEAYLALERLGLAHSIEVWQEGALVGGLYGLYLGRVFCGESMFSRVPNASKVALVALVEVLRLRGVDFIDCQNHTDHLEVMGARSIPRRQFLSRLARALEVPPDRGRWSVPPLRLNSEG